MIECVREIEREKCARMALNLSQSVMVGGLAAHYSSMAPAPVVCRAVNWSRKSSSFFVRSDLSCRASSAVDQIQIEMEQEEVEEQDYRGTPYVPVYVMLPRGVIQRDHGIVDSYHLIQQLDTLRSSKVDGVKVECWWGIVEPLLPKHYNWSNYKRLFQHVISCNLKLQVVLCFHGCVGDDLYIPLPRWVMEVGKKDPDIFFTDRDGRRNYECLTWGIDREPVLMNRTAFEVYRDFMKSFRQEFEECFLDGSITGVEIGLGPCGELRFPFQTAGCGWEYPAIEEFQCYDKYMMKSLKKAWEERGESWCGVRPTASYNGRPQKANYLEISHRYVSFHGRFFLNWYSRVLVDHAEMLLSLAKTTLVYNCNIAAKVS